MKLKAPDLMNHFLGIFLCSGLSVIHVSASAQEFTLFEGFESNSTSQPSSGGDAVSVRPGGSEPMFTLNGTSRIGDIQIAHLQHRSGETVAVQITEAASTAIPGYQGFAVTGFAAGNVRISYPAGNPCMEFLDAGVSCESTGNTARLELRTGEVQVARSAATEESAPAVDNPDNPFARIRAANAADNPASEPESQRFRPRRIPPEDVPEGMRVISTPFGDRLVQE